MRKLLVLAAVANLLVGITPAQAATPRFQVRCMSSHIATVDPIVSPGEPSAHEHEFFGSRTTNADSTYASMTASATTCSTADDTAGYWTPTLFRPDGSRVRANSLLIYYRGVGGQHTHAFPANLKMISDRFVIGPNPANLIVKFPGCWDGVHLDSPNHRSHMAFDTKGPCPASHPVRVPTITEVFRYPVNVSGFHLSSGPFATGHADFWNTWDQDALETLVDRCLNNTQQCPRIDG